jgi:Sec-independent protein secretion pathway component TatC
MNGYSIEAKNRFLLVMVNGLSTIITAFFYKENLLFSVTYQSILKLRNQQSEVLYFIFTNVTEIISVYISLAFFLSHQILLIYSIYQSFIFLGPAFFDTEYLSVRFIFKVTILFYLKSVVFFKCLLLPVSFNFFLSFKKITINNSFCLYFEAKIVEYFNFFIVLYYNNWLYFQIFAIVFLLFNYFNTPIIIKKSRKLCYYFFLLLVFLMCPTELFVQISIILFFVTFYELLLLFLILKYSFSFYRQRK